MTLVDDVAQLSESSCALEMVLRCPGEDQSESRRRPLRDPGAWAPAAVRKNPEVKAQQLDSFLKAGFKPAEEFNM